MPLVPVIDRSRYSTRTLEELYEVMHEGRFHTKEFPGSE